MSTTSSPRSGIDLSFVDPDIRPQDDLFGHVNGKYLKEHEIPEDRSQDGSFRALVDAAEEDVRKIIDEAASLDGPDAKRVADLFASFMNTAKIDELGTKPLQPILDEINAASDKPALAKILGARQFQGLVALVGTFVSVDAKDSSRYLVHVNQSGLGLPDESFYKEDSYAEIRAAYVEHLARLADMVGLPDAKDLAESVMDLETALANVSWDRVTNRDAEKTYNMMSLASVSESSPGFDWAPFLEGFGVSKNSLEEVIVRQPSFVTGAADLWTALPLQQWKNWLLIHVVSSLSPYLTEAIVEQNFDFYGRTLSGTPALRDRWKRGVALVQGAVGESVGKIYVERHFPPTSKDRMVTLVENLVEAYRQSINDLDWMSPTTQEKAQTKLGKFVAKIGYPNKWKDYSSFETKPDDLVGNVLRSNEWDMTDNLNKLGKPVDREEWFMTPQTVNAYYHPQMNEIVFPAAILQSPFFDADADDAANYGGIGAVIGHEIGHGFDDQGSRFDGDGNLLDWWEESDRTEFERRANSLIEQYNQLAPMGLPDAKVNGALTVGENIGDLGGLTIALKAYRISLAGDDAPVIDGLTGDQRVMYGWAQVWRAKTRNEEALRRLATDPHSPPDLRCNAVVTNLDTFHEAFDVTESDALYTAPQDRVRIW